MAPQHYALPAGPSPTTEAAKMGCILPQLPGSSRWPRDPVLANEMRTIKHKAGHRTAPMSGTLTGIDFDSGARWFQGHICPEELATGCSNSLKRNESSSLDLEGKKETSAKCSARHLVGT